MFNNETNRPRLGVVRANFTAALRPHTPECRREVCGRESMPFRIRERQGSLFCPRVLRDGYTVGDVVLEIGTGGSVSLISKESGKFFSEPLRGAAKTGLNF